MTVYNVEKALFIYKSVTKTQKSGAANLNLEMKYVFFRHIFVCSGHTSKLEKNVNWSSVLVVRAL